MENKYLIYLYIFILFLIYNHYKKKYFIYDIQLLTSDNTINEVVLIPTYLILYFRIVSYCYFLYLDFKY